MPSCSSTTSASAVASDARADDPLVKTAPTTPRPIIIIIIRSLTADTVGRHVDAVPLDSSVREFLLSGEDGRDVVIATPSRVLALHRRAATSQGHKISTVTTMRDSTELASMQSQLSSHKSVTDTLRA